MAEQYNRAFTYLHVVLAYAIGDYRVVAELIVHVMRAGETLRWHLCFGVKHMFFL
ncbi:hypothetical protein AB2B41_22165 [Marimonas sp. MJW-29]|uniref:Uncharacterized protein n=1 Tax=Sulfitobacter sediminis TaxID=3234186 RepID=A0ABV3RTI2_9RHOB